MKKTACILLATFIAGSCIFAETATEIIAKSVSLDVPDFSETDMNLELFDKNGKLTESRNLKQYGKYTDELVSTVFNFLSPSTIKGTRFLQAEKKDKTDDKWIYLPSLRTVRRIAPAERQKSFVGLDFSYDDMTLRKVESDTHEMINENVTKKAGDTTYNCWQIKSTPVKKNDGGYSYRMQYIDKNTYLPVFTEYYDKEGKHLKDYTVRKIQIVTGASGKKYYIRWINHMVNVQTGHSSICTLLKQTLDEPIADKYFTQNWLYTGK